MKTALQFSDQARIGRCYRRAPKKKGVLFPSKVWPNLPKRPSQLQQLIYWQNELDYWQDEVNFYHHLLTFGVFNCKPESRHKLDYLCHAFMDFQKQILPEMKAFLDDILSDTPSRDKLQVATKQQELAEHVENLKKLKLGVFPHLPELLVVSIW